MPDQLIVKCQLCFSKDVLSYSPFDEALCDWCESFVNQKRKEGLSTLEIIKVYKEHPKYNYTKKSNKDIEQTLRSAAHPNIT